MPGPTGAVSATVNPHTARATSVAVAGTVVTEREEMPQVGDHKNVGRQASDAVT